MLATAYEKIDDRYGRWTVVREFDDATILKAREIFAFYKQQGVIVNESFDDAVWSLSNQTRNVGLTMIPFEGHYYMNAIEWIGCSYHSYRDCIKTYIALNLGEIGLSTLQELSKKFVSLADKTAAEAMASNEYVNHILALLQLIPGGCEERDSVVEALEDKSGRSLNNRKGKQRRLADFNAYLRFNKILTDFWEKATRKQKLFYFPLYFWWNLTSILPLRPTEFLLTPRDCLYIDDDSECLLTIRRTKLKGSSRKIAYRIEEDYERKKYVIPGHLAYEIKSYLKMTQRMPRTEIGTLFLQQPHFNYMGMSGHSACRYYSYSCLNTCLRYFYNEAIQGDQADIARIRLGDTRHIAMASLIISGGSPVICRELAGQADIDVSSHYYSNISNLVECMTLNQYKKMKGNDPSIIGTQKYPVALPKIKDRVTDGWCDVSAVTAGDVRECLKAVNPDGQIGVCSYCKHFWPDDPGIRLNLFDEARGKQQVDHDCRYLLGMIEQVRRGLGYHEDIGVALLRLQCSSNHYSKCLLDKYEKKGSI